MSNNLYMIHESKDTCRKEKLGCKYLFFESIFSIYSYPIGTWIFLVFKNIHQFYFTRRHNLSTIFYLFMPRIQCKLFLFKRIYYPQICFLKQMVLFSFSILYKYGLLLLKRIYSLLPHFWFLSIPWKNLRNWILILFLVLLIPVMENDWIISLFLDDHRSYGHMTGSYTL